MKNAYRVSTEQDEYMKLGVLWSKTQHLASSVW